MKSRDRIVMTVNHEEADRIPISDYIWKATADRWHEEGMPVDQSPAEYFGFETVRFDCDTTPSFPVEAVEEDEEYIIFRDMFGGLRKDHKDWSTTPEVIDYPVKDRDDWERLKERLQPSRDRVDWAGNWPERPFIDEGNAVLAFRTTTFNGGVEGCRRARENGEFTFYSAYIGYDKIQYYVATEPLLLAMAMEPDWVRDMYETDAKLAIQMYEVMVEGGFEFDGVSFICDMGYVNGPIFSPRMYDEQLRPVVQQLCEYFRGEGLIRHMHTCGGVMSLIPRLIEDGIQILEPLEVKAGMDVVELKEAFGDRITLMGGIDVRAMADPDPSAIEEEIKRKIPAGKQDGGYIYNSDHSVPNNVTFERYCYIQELVHKYGSY